MSTASISSPHKLAVRLSAAAALAGLVFLTGACGGSPSAAVAHIGTTTTTRGAGGGGAGSGPPGGPTRVLKFVACMRSHGVVNFPEPIVSGDQVSIRITPSIAGEPRFKSAQAFCQSLLPGKGQGASFTTQQQADYLKAAACMRAHGIVGFPDPNFSGGGVDFPLPPGMKANAPSFEAARQICQKLIPQGLPYSN